MSQRTQFLALLRAATKLLLRDPVPMVILVVLPLITVPFVRPAFALSLERAGYVGATGYEQALPGMAVMFAFLGISFVAFAFFREHGWGTWDRVRATSLPLGLVLLAKALPYFVMVLVQQVLLLVYGATVLGVDYEGSPVGMLAVAAAFAFAIVTVGLALVAVCSTVQQVGALTNVITIIFAGLGGSFGAVELLSSGLRAAARFTPSYWAIRGYRSLILGTAGTGEVLRCSAFVALFGAVAATVALLVGSIDARKKSFA